MTLDELANSICGKVNQTETEDVTACKGFLTRRHEMIWNEALWKDALVEYRQTLDPDAADYTPASNYLPSKGVLLLPPIIQRVLGARTTERTLNIQRPEYYYRIDYDAFNQTGAPAEYILLPPCVWELDELGTFFATRASEADAEISLTLQLRDADGVGVSPVSKPLDEPEKLLGETDLIESLTKPSSSGLVTFSAAIGVNLVPDDTTIAMNGSVVITGFEAGKTYRYTAGNAGTLTTDGFVTYTDGEEFVAIAGNTYYLNGPGYGGPAPVPGITLTSEIVQVPVTVFAVVAADTNAKRRQRIRLVEIPSTEQTVRVLGKRVCPTFSSANDEPAINGMENLLIAFGLADMLQRERQYGKARELQSEALQLLKQLKEIEVVQQAHHCRILPQDGFGDDYFTGRTRGFHF